MTEKAQIDPAVDVNEILKEAATGQEQRRAARVKRVVGRALTLPVVPTKAESKREFRFDEEEPKADKPGAEEPKAESKEAPKEEPKAKAEDDRPLIELGPKDSPRLINVVAAAMKHLTDAGAKIFQRGGKLMRPVLEPSFDSEGEPVKVASLIQLDEGALQLVLMQHLRWLRRTADGSKSVNPVHTEVAPLILKARGAWPFRPVSGLITAPTLRPDGSLLDKEGYDPPTGLLLFNSIPVSVKLKPSVVDGEGALALLKGLLVEVPFADIDKMDRSPSRSVSLSLIISLAARGALETVPLHGYTSHDIGAGKSYVVTIGSYIVSGQKCAVLGATRNSEELEKKIATSLMAGRQLISLDNVNGVLASDLLSQALSEPVITHRLLGKHAELQITSKSVFAATGNNLLIADDLIRRTISASLDPKRECGWDKEFEHDPLEMIARDRAKYISAALTIPLAYIAAGSLIVRET